MKRPSFLEGAGVALVAALAGGSLHTALLVLFSPALAARLVIAAVGFAYFLYLLGRNERKTGRISAVAGWLALALAAFWLAPSLPAYVLLHVAAVWLLRSLVIHGGILAALADGGLCVLGLGAALAALVQTGSPALALWCFFLVQALFAFIPAGWPGKSPVPAIPEDRFEQAHRSAEAALRRLVSF